MDIQPFEQFLIAWHATAIHEAGHAVAGELLGFPCRYIKGALWTHDRRTTPLLRTWPNSEKSIKQYADFGVAVAAGIAAETIEAGVGINYGLRTGPGKDDYKDLVAIARRVSLAKFDVKTLKPIHSEDSLIVGWEARAMKLLKEHWDWVSTLLACLSTLREDCPAKT